jgi:hypothetical protein
VEVLPTVHVNVGLASNLPTIEDVLRRSRRVQGLDPPFIAMSTEDAEIVSLLEFEQFIGLHLSESKGLKKHGALAEQKMLEEMNQIVDDFKAFEPVDFRTLSPAVRENMINSSMFLKEKFKADSGLFDKLKARLVGVATTKIEMILETYLRQPYPSHMCSS